jgi:hypothetical protein
MNFERLVFSSSSFSFLSFSIYFFVAPSAFVTSCLLH